MSIIFIRNVLRRVVNKLVADLRFIIKKSIGYASGVDNLDLLQVVRVPISQLKSMADADLVKKAEDLVKVLTPKLPDLAGYNVVASDLGEVTTLKEDFLHIYTAPVGLRKTKAQLTEQLNGLFGMADAQLRKMDDQINTLYDTDADFCNEYNKKRALVNLAKRLRAFQMWITDAETGQPIKNAVVKLVMKADSNGMKMAKSSGADLAKNIKKTGAKGGVQNNNMAAGEYSYEIMVGNYVTATGTFFIIDGQMTEVRVTLVRNPG